MKCSVCGHEKVDYEFFRFIGRYDREFFAAGIPAKSDVCFDCCGPYKCIQCDETQPSTEYRINGRICYTCQGLNPERRTILQAQTGALQDQKVTEAINATFDGFIGGLEE